MKVFPAMHYTMGGLWVDNEKQGTNVPGIYAAGECEYQYHGANRLGANSLVSCIYGGMLAGPASVRYAHGLERGYENIPSAVYYREQRRQEEFNDNLLHQQGTENPISIWREMGEWMTEHVTVVRYNENLKKTDAKLQELQERYKKINLSDRTQWANQTLQFARELHDMLILARAITLGALARNESRGAHYKPEFPERDDANWLKTTKASYECGSIKLEYEPVDTSLIPPRKRQYGAAK
jgi:succinate dehydrogenase / fumarate reductase flavoprotein subunit